MNGCGDTAGLRGQHDEPVTGQKDGISPAPKLSSVICIGVSTHITLPRFGRPRQQCSHITVDVATLAAAAAAAAVASAGAGGSFCSATSSCQAAARICTGGCCACASTISSNGSGADNKPLSHLPVRQRLLLLQQPVISPERSAA